MTKKTIYTQQYIVITIFMVMSLGVFSQTKTVTELLALSQQKMMSQESFSCDMQYNLYNTYETTDIALQYQGRLLKQGASCYTKINNTEFITDNQKGYNVKVNLEERAMMHTKKTTDDMERFSPFSALEHYVAVFKNTEVAETNNFWICTLTSDAITQLPYGKVELYIDKRTHFITKQVLYFLGQATYKDAYGASKSANPRLEILLSNFENSLLSKDKIRTNIATYISIKNTTATPTGAYRGFTLIEY